MYSAGIFPELAKSAPYRSDGQYNGTGKKRFEIPDCTHLFDLTKNLSFETSNEVESMGD